VTIEVAGQPVSLIVAGELSASPAPPGGTDQSFDLNLLADFGELQSHLTPILQAELNRAERCGERLSIQSATLAPAAPAGNLGVQMHFEKWICIKAAGDTPKKLLESDATIHVTLTPVLEKSEAGVQSIRLDVDIVKIEADGPLGDLLRSGPLRATLRDKIREGLLKVIARAADPDGVMPSQTKRFIAIQTIGFADAGFGRLALDMAGHLRVPGEAVPAVLEQFGNR
jgi:hypothetical protein